MFKTALANWEQALSQTQAMFVRYIEAVARSKSPVTPAMNEQIQRLVRYALDQSHQFVRLLNQLGTESNALKSSPTAITVLNHIRRESEYFIGRSFFIKSVWSYWSRIDTVAGKRRNI